MDQLLRGLLSQMASQADGAGTRPRDVPDLPDTSETIKISALALLKMLKHARGGVPLEVMGLMLGEFVDDYTITITDVFAMPQSGTSVTVESVDPAYQAKMLEMLGRTGRREMVVGWYHSHPGFGCWLSGTDQHTQQSFETLHKRAVALVIDPIQSVKGKVILEAFRLVQPGQMFSLGGSFNSVRQQTSCLGHQQSTASAVAVMHGLGKKYYSLICEYTTTPRQQLMLKKLNSRSWMDGFKLDQPKKFEKSMHEMLDGMIKYTELFYKDVKKESTKRQLLEDKPKKKEDKNEAVGKFGKLNAKQHLMSIADRTIRDHVSQTLTAAAACNALKREDTKEEREKEAKKRLLLNKAQGGEGGGSEPKKPNVDENNNPLPKVAA